MVKWELNELLRSEHKFSIKSGYWQNLCHVMVIAMLNGQTVSSYTSSSHQGKLKILSSSEAIMKQLSLSATGSEFQ